MRRIIGIGAAMAMLGLALATHATHAQTDTLQVTLNDVRLQNGALRATLRVDTSGGAVPDPASVQWEARLDDQPFDLGTPAVIRGAPAALVVVVDLSASAADLGAIGAQLSALRDWPNLRVGLVGFGDTTSVLLPLSAPSALDSALAQLSPSGTRSALYAAITQAAAMLEEGAAPSERRLIFAITDSGDNLGAGFQAAAEGVKRARSELMVLGYSNKNRPRDFAALGGAVGGTTVLQGETVNFGRELSERLQQLQRVWQLSAPLRLSANSTVPRTLEVRARYGEATGSARQAVAIGSPAPRVALQTLPAASQQPVTQTVTLVAVVESELPIRRVIFRHNNVTLGEAQPPSFVWAWQPAHEGDEPQQHTLSVTAEDIAGRNAQAVVEMRTLLPPRFRLLSGQTALSHTLRLAIDNPQPIQLRLEPLPGSATL